MILLRRLNDCGKIFMPTCVLIIGKLCVFRRKYIVRGGAKRRTRLKMKETQF
jgi:hypothetical protein